MIPIFPAFKRLELADKVAIDAHITKYPPYSDFEFGSLWSWDVKEEMALSLLNDNLVIRFTDYSTGQPFYTFLGSKDVNETAHTLLEISNQQGHKPFLDVVPETSIVDLDLERFTVTESRDHFDYICELEPHLTFTGAKLQKRLRDFKYFVNTNPLYETVLFDLRDASSRLEILDLYRRWNERKGFLSLSEAFAYERFLEVAESFEYSALGIRVDGILIGFHVATLPPNGCANSLFEKADTNYRGVFQVMLHETAKDLLARGYTHINIEQDLGIETLRNSKMALDPVYFLKKYTVARRGELTL